VTLDAFDLRETCKVETSTAALRVGCTVYGAYAGRPARAGAGYGWVWTVPADAHGMTTGYGRERGTLLLDFGRRGTLTLALSGRQRPVGPPPTWKRGTVRTAGTWTVTKGTGRLAGRHGKGTYRYTLGRTGSATTFSRAELALSGSLS
jgi:hypothetical protein